MNTIFTPICEKNFTASNRLVRSATGECLADENGFPTPQLISVYDELAQGGVGTIIVSATNVLNIDDSAGGFLQLTSSDAPSAFAPLVEAIKKHGSTAWIQIMLEDFERKIDPNKDAIRCPIDQMTEEEIHYVIAQFVQASQYAYQAGFDGVQLHGAHGFFLSQSISPKYNHRTDIYGQNPTQIIEEVYYGIRNAIGDNFHIGIKINCQDFMKGGLTEEQCVERCIRLSQIGIDSIEISGNDTSRKGIIPYQNEAYFKNVAIELKKHITTPVILVGGLRTIETMNELMQTNGIDAFALSRPLIREPNLIHRWQQGDPSPSKCVSCNQCYADLSRGCIFNPYDKHK